MLKSRNNFLAALALLTALFTGCLTAEEKKFKQYYLQGQALYEKHCSNCHQPNGTGLRKLYPPLAHSDYLNNYPDNTLCLMRHGITGELVVNQITYNQPMPGIPSLTDPEIAQIATYIYNSWGNSRGLIDVTHTTHVLRACRH